MHDQRIRPGRNHDVGETVEGFFRVLIVDAEAAFHGHRHGDGFFHRRDAFADERRLAHETSAEAAVLHAVGRAADIEVDFIITEIRADLRGLSDLRGITAAELQRDRMLRRIKSEQPRTRAEDHGVGRDHLGVEQRVLRQQPVEKPAMPVGPVHHRRDGKAVRFMVPGFVHTIAIQLQEQ